MTAGDVEISRSPAVIDRRYSWESLQQKCAGRLFRLASLTTASDLEGCSVIIMWFLESKMKFAGSLLLLVLACIPAVAQQNSPVDLTGTWVWVNQEDASNRYQGVDPGGRYEGLTINDAARMRADTYSE